MEVVRRFLAAEIEAFLPVIDEAVEEGLATAERVEVRFYRSGKSD